MNYFDDFIDKLKTSGLSEVDMETDYNIAETKPEPGNVLDYFTYNFDY